MNLRLGVDVGGTFTDLCALGESGRVRVTKVVTTYPDPAEGILQGVRTLCDTGDRVVCTILGTTAGLNAVLERRGAKTALITTAGFGDIYRMGRGNRPEMYNLHYHRPKPLVPREWIFELPGRVGADADISEPLDIERAALIAREIGSGGFESVAVCLLHSYCNPAHELELAALLRRYAPGCSLSLSHQVAREWREYERTSTTVVDAYVRPILERHLAELASGLKAAGHSPEILVMRSSGGLMPASERTLEPVTVLLSGPVGGAIATRALIRELGLNDALAIDMGGTSFDVTLLTGGELPIGSETEVEGFPLLVSGVPVHTIGAGGGGVVWLEGRGLRVGPRSAGSVPGPICFRRGGTELTVTDANACLGLIRSGTFVDGDLPLDIEAAGAAFTLTAAALEMDPARLQEGVIEIVNARMVGAIRALTIEQGLDARTYSLVAYGGNGPLHAAALAEELGIVRVVIPASPGAFSAWGMLFSEVRKDLSLTSLQSSSDIRPEDLEGLLQQLGEQATRFLVEADLDPGEATYQWRAAMRYQGQEHTVEVSLPAPPASTRYLEEVLARFHELHQRSYGHSHPRQVVEFVTLRLSVLGPASTPEVAPAQAQAERAYPKECRVRWQGREVAVPIFHRDHLATGGIAGPCIVEERTATTFVPDNWTLEVDTDSRSLILQRGGS